MAGLEPATSASQMQNATNCATSISEATERASTPNYHEGNCRSFTDSFRYLLFIVSSRMSKTEVGFVCLPHHKGRKSFSIHQILMKISFQRFSASVELLTMSKNSVSRVVRSHCKCRKDFLIRQIFGRIFSCWL